MFVFPTGCSTLQYVAVCFGVLQRERERDNVVYWKTKRKIKDDLQCLAMYPVIPLASAPRPETSLGVTKMRFRGRVHFDTRLVADKIGDQAKLEILGE